MLIKKIWYKLTNQQKYQEYKSMRSLKNSHNFKLIYEPYINEVMGKISSQKELSFLHSGHLGDIINCLPVIKELSKTHKCFLYINTDEPLSTPYANHPASDVFINNKIFLKLKPLLEAQSYITNIEKYSSQKIDVNFDIFRKFPINICFDNLRYSYHVTGVQPKSDEPYLNVEKHKNVIDKIIIQRTFRYRNKHINYQFLNDYEEVYFIGTLKEYNDLKNDLPKLIHYDCKDFLEMAMIIKSCKIFIGNSSVGFPIAEALKVPRLLEACPHFPAALPHGKNAFDFFYQKHFENFFKTLYNK
ncbi:MAG: hypothetical protein ACJZ4O_02220 [Pelagibacteraceae bacterium]